MSTVPWVAAVDDHHCLIMNVPLMEFLAGGRKSQPGEVILTINNTVCGSDLKISA